MNALYKHILHNTVRVEKIYKVDNRLVIESFELSSLLGALSRLSTLNARIHIVYYNVRGGNRTLQLFCMDIGTLIILRPGHMSPPSPLPSPHPSPPQILYEQIMISYISN